MCQSHRTNIPVLSFRFRQLSFIFRQLSFRFRGEWFSIDPPTTPPLSDCVLLCLTQVLTLVLGDGKILAVKSATLVPFSLHLSIITLPFTFYNSCIALAVLLPLSVNS